MPQPISTPDDQAIDELCGALESRASALDSSCDWPAEQLNLCADYGVFRWFLPREWGGFEWSDLNVVRGYLRLSAACLTTTFVITQRTGACRRILDAENAEPKSRLLHDLAAGRLFATVGISHLTTSRRHLDRPVLAAAETSAGFMLDGYSPWVTGADHAAIVVVGATLADGRQILVALPTDLRGVEARMPVRLTGLSASHTGELHCTNVHVGREWLLAGPRENVMAQGAGANTGGLETSTLAVGLSAAANDGLRIEAQRRPDLVAPWQALAVEHQALETDLLAAASGSPRCSAEQLRTRANSHVLRATQATLSAAKGTGYTIGHPAGRWCREALFFLVWSCPQPVIAANLCELAGLGD